MRSLDFSDLKIMSRRVLYLTTRTATNVQTPPGDYSPHHTNCNKCTNPSGTTLPELPNITLLLLLLEAFSTDTTSKLDVLRHDGYSVCMKGTQVNVLKKTN